MVSSAGSGPACAGAAGLRITSDASTGTTVNDTSRDASSAAETATANGRNSSPTCPLTSPIGANTATVVTVDAVIAPATSRTAVRIAARRGPP